MPNLPTEVVDTVFPPCAPCGEAGFIMLSAAVTPPPSAPPADPGDLPPEGSSAEEYEAYFAELAKRTAAMRDKHDAEVQADMEARAESLKSLGWYGAVAAGFYKTWIKVGFALAKLFYGTPDWNDPKWTEAAVANLKTIMHLGFGGFPPYVGPDRASTEDAIDWAEETALAVRRLDLFGARFPEKALDLATCFDWMDANSSAPVVRDLVQSGMFPPPMARGGIGLSTEGIVGLARAVALAKGKATAPVVADALAIERDLNSGDELDPTGTPYRYSGNPYALGTFIARVLDAADAAPLAPRWSSVTRITSPFGGDPFGGGAPELAPATAPGYTPRTVTDSGGASPFGDTFGRLGTGGTASGGSSTDTAAPASAGNAGVLVGLVLAYAAFQVAFAGKR